MLRSILPALTLLLLPLSAASAAVIVYEDFSGSSAHVLSGSSTDAPGGAYTWSAGNSLFKQDGSTFVNSTNQASSVAVDLGAGYFTANPAIYSLSLDVTLPADSTNRSWLALGFTNTTGGGANMSNSTTDGSGGGGRPWMLIRGDGDINLYRGTGTSGSAIVSDFATTGTAIHLELVLNTTNTTTWTVQAYANNQLVGTISNFSPVDIRYVSIGTGYNSLDGTGNTTNFTVDNFMLQTVPEPGAFGMLLPALGLVLIRRRRK
jgi:hypothetical protein